MEFDELGFGKMTKRLNTKDFIVKFQFSNSKLNS